jgi:hypothetical protein
MRKWEVEVIATHSVVVELFEDEFDEFPTDGDVKEEAWERASSYAIHEWTNVGDEMIIINSEETE